MDIHRYTYSTNCTSKQNSITLNKETRKLLKTVCTFLFALFACIYSYHTILSCEAQVTNY